MVSFMMHHCDFLVLCRVESHVLSIVSLGLGDHFGVNLRLFWASYSSCEVECVVTPLSHSISGFGLERTGRMLSILTFLVYLCYKFYLCACIIVVSLGLIIYMHIYVCVYIHLCAGKYTFVVMHIGSCRHLAFLD